MKILFYTDTPNVGGAEQQMLMLAKHLNLNGLKVSLAYGAYSKISKMHDDFEKWCEAIYVLPTFHKHDPRHYSRLKKILKTGGFDLIHIHLWNPGSCRYAFFAASHLGIPIVVTEHDPFELSGLKKIIKQNCIKKTNQTIAISSLNSRLLGEYYGIPEKALNLVPNGIEMDMFLDNLEKAELPVEDGKIIVTSIGELHPRKGHRYLLEAFRKLRLESPNLHLVIAGAGPSEFQYKEEFSDLTNVTFLGWRSDIPQILKASNIFVLPSLREAFGLVILEAMASGVVVIATNSSGATDIIKDGITGYIIPPANSDRIVEAIFEIIRNPDKKRQMEIAAIESVRKNFTAEVMAKRTMDVYTKLATK